MIKIDKKIVSYKVVTEESTKPIIKETPIVSLCREEVLSGKTYKIKPSTSNDAYYITINDRSGKPFEIFINSKGIQQFRFMALTRLISALFRTQQDLSFVIEELKAVHDPVGSYTSKRCYPSGKRKRFDSIEAEIGDIIKEHINMLDPAIAEVAHEPVYVEQEDYGYPENATVCTSCNEKAVIIMDGCATCLSCGQSKCN